MYITVESTETQTKDVILVFALGSAVEISSTHFRSSELATLPKPAGLHKIYGELLVSALPPVEWHSHLLNNGLIHGCCVKWVTLPRSAEDNGFGGYINGAGLYLSQSFMVLCAWHYFHFSHLFEINMWEYFLPCFRGVFRQLFFIRY